MYKIEVYKDSNWEYEGTYISVESLANACFRLGKEGVEQIAVHKKENNRLSDDYRPEGWGTGATNNKKVQASYAHTSLNVPVFDLIEMGKEDTMVYEYQHQQTPKKYGREK